MGEKRSNHTVYNVNYHFVWCPKYRHAILEAIEDSLESSFRDVCDEYGYDILSLHISPDHVICFCQPTRNTHRAKSCGRSRASRRGRCGDNTNRSWRSICGVAGFGRNRTTSGRQEMFRPTRLSSILSERNTFSGAYGPHPRGQAPRHSACPAYRSGRRARAGPPVGGGRSPPGRLPTRVPALRRTCGPKRGVPR